MSIIRTDVVTQVADAVRQWIIDGEIGPGERINETHVATRLKVSRTPVREALARLVGEGALISIPNLGFFVAEISEAELDEVYGLRPILDSAALEMGGPPPPSSLAKLKNLNVRLAKARDAAEAVAIDEQWHMLLISRCTNEMLLGFIRRLMDRTRRYELILFEKKEQRRAAAAQHDEVLDALGRGDVDGASRALRHNLTSGDRPLRQRVRRSKHAISGA